MRKLLLSLTTAIGLAAASTPLRAEVLTGLTTTNQLVTFDSATPGTINSTVAITGLQAGETILGIDVRPATGTLYGLGSTSRLYIINPVTGAATAVGSPGSFTLSGTSFGFDFSPVADRIRVTSNAAQNLLINPDTGIAAVQTNLSPGIPDIAGSAFSNDAFAILYDIDATTDSLLMQIPPQTGILTTVGVLGFDTSDLVGFDISGLSGSAFASLTAPGANGSELFTINLGTGAATLVGGIGTGVPLNGLAAQIAAVPEPATWAMMLIGLGGIGFAMRRQRPSAATAHPA